MNYVPPDNDLGHGGRVVTKEVMSQRNLWLFVSFIILPVALVIGGMYMSKLFRQLNSSQLQAAITSQGESQASSVLSTVSSVPAVPQAEHTSTSAPAAMLGVTNKPAISTAEAASVANIQKPLVVTIKSKDNLKKLFKRNGLNEKDALAILAIKKASSLKNLHAGKKISLTLDATKTKLQVLEYKLDDLTTLVVTARKGGWSVDTKHIKPTTKTKYAAATITGSIYTAGKRAGVPQKLVAQMVNAFSNRVNVKKIHDGDKFALLYNEYTLDGKKVRDSDIAVAELVHKGETHRIVSFTDSYGHTNFYTPQGHSIKPAFERYPVAFNHIGSRFSHARHHPILGTVRAHTGVDLSADRGAPIKATGNGKIVFAGTSGGYGNVVRIKHGIYETVYAHLSRFSNKVYTGGYVKQGDVIGYVGSSGLATGPHLHYELRVNGVPHDPLKVKLPSGQMIASEHRNRFFALSKKVLSQLDSYRKGIVKSES